MTMPKKYRRKIVVDGKPYFYVVRRDGMIRSEGISTFVVEINGKYHTESCIGPVRPKVIENHIRKVLNR